MSQRRPNVWELVVNLGREVRPALRSIPDQEEHHGQFARARSIPAYSGSRNEYWAKQRR